MIQGPNPPRNCSCAFSKEGDQIFTNRNYTAEQNRARFLSGDVEEEIRCVCVCAPEFVAPLVYFNDEKSLQCDNLSFALTNDSSAVPPLSHQHSENENLRAKANRFQHQIRKMDEDIKQNQVLLRRADAEKKTAKVRLSFRSSFCVDGRSEIGACVSVQH